MRARLVAPAALLAALVLGGCGGQRSSSSSATTATSTGSASTATADDTVTNAPPTVTAGTSAVAGATAARLKPTRGYGTYEACQGTCTGSVPASLRRPLHLPADDNGPCPITIHVAGPVAPRQVSAGVGFHTVQGSGWLGAQVTWVAAGAYAGPILIRGAMVGGGAVGFGTGAAPHDELQLLDTGRGAPHVDGNGRAWITYTRVRSAGCYAYQVDGMGFSEVVVFRAVG